MGWLGKNSGGFLGGGFRHASPASGPVLVQQAVGTSADGTNGVIATLPSSLEDGDSLIASISFVSSSSIDGDVSIFGDNIFVPMTAGPTSTVEGVTTIIYYAHVVPADTNVFVRVTLVDPVRASISAAEFSGLLDFAPVVNSNSGTSTSPSTGSVTPAVSSNLIVAVYASILNSYVSGPTAGATALTAVGGTDCFQQEGYIIQQSATAKNIGWTITSDSWAACAAAFRGQ